jgi:hypothetical protein
MRHFIQDKLTDEQINAIASIINGEYQPLLVSGTNVKTVNGNSILGSGDIITLPIRLNDVIQTGYCTLEIFDGTIAGGAGQISKFLTSDGLTKSGGNTFLYSNILSTSGIVTTITAVNVTPIATEFTYNLTTGELIVDCVESKNTGVLIGGNVEGLEFGVNGRNIRITALALL